MPAIAPELRPPYDNILKQITEIKTKGDLEYCVYQLILKYMKTREWRYANLHDAVYAPIHSAMEFKRLKMDPYEDEAYKRNGEIICDGEEIKNG
jgi:hypothetical protein